MDGFLLIVHVFVYVNTAGVEDPIVREQSHLWIVQLKI